ncbi:MAG: hypothetical protein JNK60_19820 [Acidobacteria bacterium]|nr:hypothetical protein [Acidobacteriota bacterium]
MKVAILPAMVLLAGSALADGVLDPTFGANGKVRVAPTPYDLGRIDAVAHQSDGRIIAAGTVYDVVADPQVRVMRFTPAGTVDPTFNFVGIGDSRFGGQTAVASSMVVLPNGKILVSASKIFRTSEPRQAVISRLDEDGFFDPSFGQQVPHVSPAGRILSPALVDGHDGGRLVLEPGGEILFVGTGPEAEPPGIGILRFLANGEPDTGFGVAGRAAVDTGSVRVTMRPNAFVQPDGKIVVAGAIQNQGSIDFFAVRLMPGGSVDPTFGTGGSVSLGLGNRDESAVAVLPGANGSVILCGNSRDPQTGNQDFAMARLTASGVPDPTFGTTGTGWVLASLSPISSDTLSSALRSGARILLAGSAASGAVSTVLLARFSLDGIPDPTFPPGGAGIVMVPFGVLTTEVFNAAALSPDGRMLVGGSVADAALAQDLALMRFDAPCLPGFALKAPPSVCPGGEAVATVENAGTGGTFTWAIQNGTILSGQGTGSVRYSAGSTGATLLTVTGTNGSCEANGSARTFIDVHGCTPPLGYHTVPPCRIVDTRLEPLVSGLGGPSLLAGRSRAFLIRDRCGVLADARAVTANVTVLNASSPGLLQVYAEGASAPPSSVVAYPAGAARATFAQIVVGEDVAIRIKANQPSGTADVLVDVSGYYK